MEQCANNAAFMQEANPQFNVKKALKEGSMSLPGCDGKDVKAIDEKVQEIHKKDLAQIRGAKAVLDEQIKAGVDNHATALTQHEGAVKIGELRNLIATIEQEMAIEIGKLKSQVAEVEFKQAQEIGRLNSEASNKEFYAKRASLADAQTLRSEAAELRAKATELSNMGVNAKTRITEIKETGRAKIEQLKIDIATTEALIK